MDKIEQPKLRILIVEDNPGDIALMKQRLMELGIGHELFALTSGEEALNYLDDQTKKGQGEEQWLPQLIMIDLGLPGENGLDILSKLKDHEMLRDIPVIVVTVIQMLKREIKVKRLKTQKHNVMFWEFQIKTLRNLIKSIQLHTQVAELLRINN